MPKWSVWLYVNGTAAAAVAAVFHIEESLLPHCLNASLSQSHLLVLFLSLINRSIVCLFVWIFSFLLESIGHLPIRLFACITHTHSSSIVEMFERVKFITKYSPHRIPYVGGCCGVCFSQFLIFIYVINSFQRFRRMKRWPTIWTTARRTLIWLRRWSTNNITHRRLAQAQTVRRAIAGAMHPVNQWIWICMRRVKRSLRASWILVWCAPMRHNSNVNQSTEMFFHLILTFPLPFQP